MTEKYKRAIEKAHQARRDNAARRRTRAMVNKLRDAGWILLPPKMGGGNYAPGEAVPLDEEETLFAVLEEEA